MTEQELMLQEEEARARASADQEQNAKLEAEINASGPRNASGSPDDRQVLNDQAKQDAYDNNYVSGIQNVPHNTYLEAKGLAKGVARAGLGALQTSIGVGGFIGKKIGEGWDAVVPESMQRSPERVKSGQDNIARELKAIQDVTPEATTNPDKFFVPAGQIGANIAAAGGAGGAVKEALTPALGKIGGYVTGALTGGATAAASFPEQQGLIVRDGGFAGFDIKPDDDAATQQTKKFVNQALDNAALGAAGDVVYRAGTKSLEVVRNMYNDLTHAHSLPKLKQDQMESLMTIFGQYGEHPTAEQAQEAMQRAIKAIDEKGTEAIDFGAAGTKTVKKDTVQTLVDSLDPNNPMDRSIAAKLESLRASAKRGIAPRTSDQIMEPGRVLNQGLEDSQNIRGGSTAIEQTRQNLQERAQAEMATHDVPVQMAKDDLVQQSADYTDVLKKDPTFGPAISKAETEGIPLDVHKAEQGIQNQIVDRSKAALETDRNVRNAAYKAVANTNAPANMEQFMAKVNENEGSYSPELQKLIDNADGTYGYLYNKLRPRLSKEIRLAQDAGKDPQPLYDLRKEIDEGQIDWLTGKAGPFGLPTSQAGGAPDLGQTVKTAAENAKKVNTEYSAKWKDTIGDELRNNFDKNRLAPGNLQEKGRTIVDNTIATPNKVESVQNLKNILGPQDENLIGDLTLTKATKDIQRGKGANFDKITTDLQDMAKNFGPQQKARLEGFLNDVRNKKMSLDDLDAKIPELQRAADAEKEQMLKDRFPDLFEKVGMKQVPQGNGYDIFEKVMDSAQPRKLEALINEAKKTPGDISGFETAWLRSAQKKIEGGKSVGKLDENFIENGKKIFGDDSPEVKAITTLRDMSAKIEESANKPGNEALSATEHAARFNAVLGTIRTWIFGVLNPKAAKIRTVMNRMSEAYNPVEKNHQAIDELLADNQEAKKVLEQLINKYKSQLSPATWKTLWTAGARMGLYETRPTSKLNIQTNQALGQ